MKDLIADNYPGAQEIYDELYAWKVTCVAVNTKENDTSTDYSSISKYNTWYAHFEITGGPFEGTVQLSDKIVWPDGSVRSDQFDWISRRGDTFYESGWYETPAYGATGTVTVIIYADGREIGRKSFSLTN